MRRFDKGQASSTTNQGTGPTQGSSNLFPYGQCTWWANERYHELHGIYVPWTTQSDAWRNLATDGLHILAVTMTDRYK